MVDKFWYDVSATCGSTWVVHYFWLLIFSLPHHTVPKSLERGCIVCLLVDVKILDASYTKLKVLLVAIKHGIFFLKLGYDRIWSIKFLASVLIFRQRMPQNLSKIEKI
jgi:hypothetical protein